MKIYVFCLCCLLILTAPGVMAQQGATPHQSWDVLRQLQAGEKLWVERKTGKKKVSGKFISLSDTELVIERRRKNESINRDEVKNIWRSARPRLKKRLIFADTGAAVGTLPGVTAQHPTAPNQSWDVLRQLQVGDKLLVEEKGGGIFFSETYSGKVVSLSDAELVIERNGKNKSISRDEVKKIWMLFPPSRSVKVVSAAALGGLGAFLVGMIISVAAECDDCEAEKAGAVVVFTAIFALAGYFIPGDNHALVYSAP